MTAAPPLEWTDLDRRIWEEELDEFVPRRVFDVHTHLYRWAFYLDSAKEKGPYRALLGTAFADATWELADAVDALLMPGRAVRRLSFPFPFPHPCDFAASNAFLAAEVARDPHSAGLMLVHPGMTADEAEEQVERCGFLGFKPYRFYASSGDAVNCRITDFMPEHLIALADRRGLLIMMHLSKRDAVADPENVNDLLRLGDKYPGARWVLAHCARSYSAWAIEKAARHLRGLPNVWYDTSSVCESDALEALYAGVGADRVMYGSDDIPVGVLRGKYVAFGRAWAYLSECNHRFDLSHCDPRMTFTRYEQLRAMRRAARRLGMSREQTQALFHDTAADLIARVRRQPVAPAGGKCA
ncbi:MAG TPA: amidohydrolase family protein [Gemmataceae bacterium]|nr:amidohydrolase family protein [Gemmataceae bacterium]